MDTGIFDEIQKRYQLTENLFELFKKDIKLQTRVNYEFDHLSEIDDELEAVKDLFIIDFFAAFERLLRYRLSASIVSHEDALSENFVEIVRRESEYIKIEYLLDILKNFADSQQIGLIKQIKKYRDWIAHGRKFLSKSPAKPVDIYVIFEAIRLMGVVVDTERFLNKQT